MIDVVDVFLRKQKSTEFMFHHQAVNHDEDESAILFAMNGRIPAPHGYGYAE